MNDTADASSKYQDSLPISSVAIMEQLDICNRIPQEA
jgi:hypothetical protein